MIAFLFNGLNRLNWQTGKPDKAALCETLIATNPTIEMELKNSETC
jgi:hypothetical protein